MMLGTVIHPKNRILPLLRGHFCSRLPDEDFMIFDATHGIAMLRRDRKVQYMVMEHYDKNTGRRNWTGKSCGNAFLMPLPLNSAAMNVAR